MLESCSAWVGVLLSAMTLLASSVASADQPIQRASVVTVPTGLSCQAAKCNPNFPMKITNELAQLSPDYCAMPVQANLDFYAWREFIALNWPADTGTCGADLDKTILDSTGPRVWQTWLSGSEVMVDPDTFKPSAWCPASRAKKTQTFKAQDAQQPVGGVLIDQNGRFTRHETRMNEDVYNYVVTNNLWNKAGQLNARINMPTGPGDLLCNGKCCGSTGSILVKASWKVLGANDDKSRFYTLQATLLDVGTKPPGNEKHPPPALLGMVGLHIAHKTANQKNWIWATFEHVDNVTKLFNNPRCPQKPVYNPDAPVPCTQECCPPNSQTAAKGSTGAYVELSPAGKPLHRPTQVVRVQPITNVSMNKQFQALLKGSVWENYELVSTQWVDNQGNTQPEFAANTTLETFAQGPTPPTHGKLPYKPLSTRVSSSCMKCHATAKSLTGGFADFSFFLGTAPSRALASDGS